MVYIKKSEKLISFLKTFHEESSKSLEEISKETKNPFIELKNIEIYLSLWNTKFPDSLKYLHNMITYDDIVYTLEYRDYERDLEFNTPQWNRTKEKIKERQQEREYQKMLNKSKSKTNSGFSLFAPGDSVKDFEQSISFGVSFIVSLFLSGLSGYYFGIYCLGASQNKSLVLAAIVTILTIIMETFLFMIKIGRKTKNEKTNSKDKII